ncbi:MAG: histidine kinase [Rothia sp. (in: high G+C Gram-positive bacteria)]|nr:histidine kinase [Rothia sp. (in: high G+C Gram-positive bacteria)]
MENSSVIAQTPVKRSLWRALGSPTYLFSAAPWIALFHLLLLSVVATLAGSLLATFFLIPLIPIVALWFGYFERWRVQNMGFGHIKNQHVNLSRSDLWAWIKFRYTEPATWREILALTVSSLLGLLAMMLVIAEFTLVVSALGLAYITYFAPSSVTGLWLVSFGDTWYLSDQVHPIEGASNQLLVSHEWLWLLYLAVLLLTLVFGAYLNGIVTAVSGSISKALLNQRPEEYERQLAKLSTSRSTIVDSFETERRRIERDLHDGVQQELVNINLRLGLAEMEAKTLGQKGADVRLLEEHMSGARQQISHALQTLRNTVRGIYPAVLETHGLSAALEELASHTLLPIRINYLVNERIPANVQRTAYYVASEGVANALKHARASEITVEVSTAQDGLVLTVTDNGYGGAEIGAGSGLSGLSERVATIGGRLSVHSPSGGPTVLRADLPLC